MAGRPRLPRDRKIIQGTFHKYRNPENEPEFTALAEIPSPPDKLNEYGKVLWEKLIAELINSGIITQADLTAFEMMCASYGRYKVLETHIEESLIANIESEKGGVSAQVRQMNAEFEMCQKMMARFGLTPSDRNRIGLSKKKETDPDTLKMRGLISA